MPPLRCCGRLVTCTGLANWWTVRVEFTEKFPRLLTLNELKDHFTPEELPALKRGSRLSVLPVADKVAERILTLARRG